MPLRPEFRGSAPKKLTLWQVVCWVAFDDINWTTKNVGLDGVPLRLERATEDVYDALQVHKDPLCAIATLSRDFPHFDSYQMYLQPRNWVNIKYSAIDFSKSSLEHTGYLPTRLHSPGMVVEEYGEPWHVSDIRLSHDDVMRVWPPADVQPAPDPTAYTLTEPQEEPAFEVVADEHQQAEAQQGPGYTRGSKGKVFQWLDENHNRMTSDGANPTAIDAECAAATDVPDRTVRTYRGEWRRNGGGQAQ